MSNDIPIFDGNGEAFNKDPGAFLEFGMKMIQGSSAYSSDRNRPYNGQPWTCNGIRGKQEVHGITFRDIQDCFFKALLICAPQELGLYDKVENGTWVADDCYGWDLDQVDPIAVSQNLACEIEKMMGIFPNVNIKGIPSSEEIFDTLINPDNMIGE